MEELIKNWEKRMNAYRLEADTTESNIQSIKAMHNFMTLRDCIKELKQQLILSGVSQQRELLSQYNNFVNMQYHGCGLDDSDIKDFNDWLNCG